jgi:hypothetical protein
MSYFLGGMTILNYFPLPGWLPVSCGMSWIELPTRRLIAIIKFIPIIS